MNATIEDRNGNSEVKLSFGKVTAWSVIVASVSIACTVIVLIFHAGISYQNSTAMAEANSRGVADNAKAIAAVTSITTENARTIQQVIKVQESRGPVLVDINQQLHDHDKKLVEQTEQLKTISLSLVSLGQSYTDLIRYLENKWTNDDAFARAKRPHQN